MKRKKPCNIYEAIERAALPRVGNQAEAFEAGHAALIFAGRLMVTEAIIAGQIPKEQRGAKLSSVCDILRQAYATAAKAVLGMEVHWEYRGKAEELN